MERGCKKMAQKVTRQKSLKKRFLKWVQNLSEEEFKFFFPERSKEEELLSLSREKEENLADLIGWMSYQYLTKWPNEDKYDKAAQLLSIIPDDSPLGVYAFQNLRSCLGWFPGFDPEKLEEALKRYESA